MKLRRFHLTHKNGRIKKEPTLIHKADKNRKFVKEYAAFHSIYSIICKLQEKKIQPTTKRKGSLIQREGSCFAKWTRISLGYPLANTARVVSVSTMEPHI